MNYVQALDPHLGTKPTFVQGDFFNSSPATPPLPEMYKYKIKIEYPPSLKVLCVRFHRKSH